jgi:uncharacterized repeat protein (TIGR01451 family)
LFFNKPPNPTNLKKIFLTISVALLFITYTKNLSAQCGVAAKIGITNNSWNNPTFLDSSTLQPNWKIYNYDWILNNSVTNYHVFSYPVDIPLGLNKMCMNVYATDTITGDSCMNSYCNIFQGAGEIPWVTLEVDSVAPLTYQFSVRWNHFYYFQADFLLKFGDGDSTTLFDDGMDPNVYTHTYPSSGNYVARLTMGGFPYYWNPISINNFIIHVDNGIQNINWINTSNYSDCDSIQIYANSSNSAYTGFVSFAYSGTSALVQFDQNINFQPGVAFKMPVFPIPGIKLMQTTIYDQNGGVLHKYDGVTTYVCDIVPDTVRGKVFSDIDADGILDSNETGIPSYPVNLFANNYGTTTDILGNYKLLIPNGGATIQMPINQSLITIPAYGYYDVGQTNQNYNFGISAFTTRITGTVFIDYNNDSIYNTNDRLFRNVLIEAYNTLLQRSYYYTTNNQGYYDLRLPAGNYVVTPVTSLLDSAWFFPDSIVISSPSGGTYSNNDFAANTTLQGANLGIGINKNRDPRPGFDYNLIIGVGNSGIDSSFGNVTLHYDANLYFDSISPAPTSLDTINHVVEWQTGYAGLMGNNVFRLFCTVPASLPLGTLLSCIATIAPDSSVIENNLLNNSFVLNDLLIGSFDPNDKIVSPTGIGATGAVYHQQKLNYRINFQNTGTASAINVIVQDDLSPDLDISTFVMEGASHQYTVFINDRTITWKFLGINLPDSNSAEPLSHGYIEFSIYPHQGLPDGTIIENDASINFDFNDPVITNIVQNTLQTYIPCDSIISIQYLKPEYCQGETVTVKITSAGELMLSWYIDSVFFSNADSINITGLLPGSHLIVLVAGNNLCSSEMSGTIQVLASPVISLGPDTSNCILPVPIIAPAGFAGYQWNTGNTSETITADSSGTYIVAVTDSLGCTSTDSIDVTIHTVSVNLGNDTTVCGNLILDAGSGFAAYSWSTGATSQTAYINTGKIYTVTVTDANGCTNSDNIEVTLYPLPTVVLNAFFTDTLCLGNGSQLINMGTPAGGTLSGNGVSGISFDPAAAGTGWNYLYYSFTDTTSCSAMATDSVFIDACMGINALENFDKINISPNPATDRIYFTCSKSKLPCDIMIYDMLGIKLKEVRCEQTKFMIDLSTLPSGNFLVKVTGANNLFAIQRIVKL